MEPMPPPMIRPVILVVDDSPAMRRYLRTLLESDCCGVETASTGAEALEHVRSGHRPDVVLLDIQMPGMDGLKTLRELRKIRPDLKVIICSGVDDPHQMRRAVQLGAYSYLTKPVQHLYLSAAIEHCLRQKEPARIPPALGDNVVSFGTPRVQ